MPISVPGQQRHRHADEGRKRTGVFGRDIAHQIVADGGADNRQEGVGRADREIELAGDHQDADAERHDAEWRDGFQYDRDVGRQQIAEVVRETAARQ